VSALRCSCYVRVSNYVSTTSKSRQGDSTSFDQIQRWAGTPTARVDRTTRLEFALRLFGPRQHAKEKTAGPRCPYGRRPARCVRLGRCLRFDRFARSVKQLVLALEEFRSLGIDFVSQQEALDNFDANGQGDVHDYRRHGRTGAQCHSVSGWSRAWNVPVTVGPDLADP